MTQVTRIQVHNLVDGILVLGRARATRPDRQVVAPGHVAVVRESFVDRLDPRERKLLVECLQRLAADDDQAAAS